MLWHPLRRHAAWASMAMLAMFVVGSACASGADGKKKKKSSSSSGAAGAGGGGGAGGSGGSIGPPTTHFAAQAQAFSVPMLGDGYGFYAVASSSWATMDINGDGLADLVHTADPTTGTVWGGDAAASWHVYLGQGDGFAVASLAWPVPTLGDGYGYYAVSSSSWATMDIDGDGKVDLVHTADPSSGTVWGGDTNATWRVYRGQANGFAATPTSWQVPTLGDGYGFYALASSSWVTMDIDGDGKVDLVHTADPSSGTVWGGDSNATWRVYPGGASGFAATPTSWQVPTLGDGYGFYAVASSGWTTMDLDGDGYVDLVQSADPNSGQVWGGDANASWLVHSGQAGGFASPPLSWKVPTLGDGYGFYQVSSSSWATMDIDGDGHADLVHTADPSTGEVWGGDANATWRVYLAQSSGFAAAPSAWSVPTLGDGYGFYAVASSSWATLDMNGDRRVDLVHTSDPSTGTVWGGDAAASWNVYAGEP